MEPNEYIEKVVRLENLIILFVAKISGIKVTPNEDTIYDLLNECDALSKYIEEHECLGYLSKVYLNLLGEVHGRLIYLSVKNENGDDIQASWQYVLGFVDSEILKAINSEKKQTMNINFWQQLAEKNQIEENNL